MLGCNHLACGREAIQVTVTVVQGRGIERCRASWGAGGLGGVGGWEHFVVNWTEQGKVAVHLF